MAGNPAATAPATSVAEGVLCPPAAGSLPPSSFTSHRASFFKARCSWGVMKYWRSREATVSAKRGLWIGVVSSAQGFVQMGQESPCRSLKHFRQADRPQHRAMLGSSKMPRHRGHKYSGGQRLLWISACGSSSFFEVVGAGMLLQMSELSKWTTAGFLLF
eukprot:CAMPEP_0113822422 /NCGR_PEP_ID=MMETSP0328-20130328/2233_1 /TAXON_ID=39455 /ORGANISM="Alexandrium minutum" /LENGTH=159 /DNA_ID=CAMNT_0000790359 /DNA_START=110 /DNA_END=589 /DNA_ORIENTATION=+ /assembly_acc=CAM_ASM_000350